jgi:8-oxo-dGTP diphosphatase
LQFRFCPKCGQEFVEKNIAGRKRLVCSACQFIFYQNPMPASVALVARNNQLLLVRRKYEPGAGQWCLPGGFVETDETAAEAAVRETKEETGLDIKITNLFRVMSNCGSERKDFLVVYYIGEILSGRLCPGDDAMEAQFFSSNALPDNIAFLAHRKSIDAFFEDVEFTANAIEFK